MNVALPALIVFLVLLPGFIFRTRLKRAERTSLDFSPFGHVAASAVSWAVVVHLAWLTMSYGFFGQQFDPIVLMKLLSAAPGGQMEAVEAVADDFGWIAAYFVTLLFASMAVPSLIRAAITAFGLDRASSPVHPIVRFHDAPWYYLLTGADIPEEDAPAAVVVSAIVEVGKDAFLYTGVLDKFYFDPQGQLDRLVLQEVARRPVAQDKGLAAPEGEVPPERFYPVEGDAFVLRYSEMITLNVRYVYLSDIGKA